MAGRKKRRKKWGPFRNFFGHDPCDGLEVNRINTTRFVSKRDTTFSVFDAYNICIEVKKGDLGRRFQKVSIMGEVTKVNDSKADRINGYKAHIKGRF